MFTLTTPRAILLGFLVVALAVGSIPFGMKLMDVNAQSSSVTKIAICNESGSSCAEITKHQMNNGLYVFNRGN